MKCVTGAVKWLTVFRIHPRLMCLAIERNQDYQSVMHEIDYYYSDPDGFEVVLTKERGRSYPWHMHTRHWTLGVVRLGAVHLSTHTGGQRLETGQFFIINPFELHALQVEPKSILYVVCLEKQRMLHSANGLGNLERPLSFFTPRTQGLMEEAFAALQKSFLQHGVCGLARSKGDSSLVMAIGELTQYMLKTPGEALSVEQMAAHAGYSPWHFVRAFRKMVGMPPHAFQILCRLRLLRTLLRADTAAADAAVSAGFVDQSHMHQVFKRYHALTPREFQRASIRLAL